MLLRLAVGVVLAFIYLPLIVIAIYAFNAEVSTAWPPDGLTLKWFGEALDNPGARDAFVYSLKTGALATVIALILGTLA